MENYSTAQLFRVASRLEGAAEALKLEARRLVPLAVGIVEAEGELELVLLLGEIHFVVGVHVTVLEDVIRV